MNVPDSCIPWIKLQRTGYGDPKYDYKLDMINEYKAMFKYLPDKCDSILDIGCGVAGIDVHLSNCYKNPRLYLLDNSKVSEKPIYGYNKTISYYNSFDAVVDMMESNNIPNYQLIDISRPPLPKLENVELVISLLSWGYHYPVHEYIKYVLSVISKKGVLIIDIRDPSDGINHLRSSGFFVTAMFEKNKARRVVAWL